MTHQLELLPNSDHNQSDQDLERREYYVERLRAALRDPEFRNTEGFPGGRDEAILALSDPPYYTACPNPFLSEVLAGWLQERQELRRQMGLDGTDAEQYHRDPFAADVSEGKSDPIYNAHGYHTKVPHKAIMRYILHYTDPGDVVFDGFCGSGMTGVAAQLCGDRRAVEGLGYRVDASGKIWDGDNVISRLGVRKAVLNDLSPAATFIAYNYNTSVNSTRFEQEARHILDELDRELGWMYETWHPHCDAPDRIKGKISYTVWSEVFSCTQCGGEIIYLEEAMDPETLRVIDTFACPHCKNEVSKRRLARIRLFEVDRVTGEPVEVIKRVPVKIVYTIGRQKFTKTVDQMDKEVLSRAASLSFPSGFPIEQLPYMHMTHERARMSNYGITNIHHFYLARAKHALAFIWTKAKQIHDVRLRTALLFLFEQAFWTMSIQNAYRPTGFSQVAQYMKGIYYVPAQISEISPRYIFEGKVSRLVKVFTQLNTFSANCLITTQSATTEQTKECILDYIFIDPPFGENIYYADLNYIVETWHGLRTNAKPEAIIDHAKRKDLKEYGDLMRNSFIQFFRKLKPGRWMTVEFHNSHNSVWNVIQQALMDAGFVVADVRTLDKQSASYRQVTAASAARQDLVITAYKPNGNLENNFELKAGTEEGAWEFVRYHLTKPARVVETNNGIQFNPERQPFLLFDRMVGFHLQHGIAVPLSAAEFYAGLRERFIERDGMVFLPDQVSEYDMARMRAGTVVQLAFLVTDEKTALAWLRQALNPETGGSAQTYQEIQPKFLRQLQQADYEVMPDLHVLLEENFLCDDQDRWYVPDENSATDKERMRNRVLLREFEGYLTGQGRLRQFRTEALRAGFLDRLNKGDYPSILQVAKRIPEDVLYGDKDLLMYYDSAVLRTEN